MLSTGRKSVVVFARITTQLRNIIHPFFPEKSRLEEQNFGTSAREPADVCGDFGINSRGTCAITTITEVIIGASLRARVEGEIQSAAKMKTSRGIFA